MKIPSVPPVQAPRPGSETDDPDAPPSEEELRQAAELRDALADPTRPNEGAALARAVVLAHAPGSRPLDRTENEALVQRALGLGRGAAPVASLAAARDRRVRRALLGGAASVAALAASVLLFQQQGAPAPVASLDAPPQLHARSSQPLFHEPFATRGGTSSRIDRIASARAGDLRENMFARWDVR